MNPGKYRGERDDNKSQISFLKLVVAGLVGLLLLMGFAVVNLIGENRQTLVPPSIDKTFWVNKKRVSPEYLEQMGYFIGQLVLSVTPASVDYQNKVLLQYACPSAHGKLKVDQTVAGNALRRDSISTFFATRLIQVDEKTLQVALPGTMSTWISNKKAPDYAKTYLAKFEYLNGRICVADFKETSSDDPFGLKPANATAAQ